MAARGRPTADSIRPTAVLIRSKAADFRPGADWPWSTAAKNRPKAVRIRSMADNKRPAADSILLPRSVWRCCSPVREWETCFPLCPSVSCHAPKEYGSKQWVGEHASSQSGRPAVDGLRWRLQFLPVLDRALARPDGAADGLSPFAAGRGAVSEDRARGFPKRSAIGGAGRGGDERGGRGVSRVRGDRHRAVLAAVRAQRAGIRGRGARCLSRDRAPPDGVFVFHSATMGTGVPATDVLHRALGFPAAARGDLPHRVSFAAGANP